MITADFPDSTSVIDLRGVQAMVTIICFVVAPVAAWLGLPTWRQRTAATLALWVLIAAASL